MKNEEFLRLCKAKVAEYTKAGYSVHAPHSGAKDRDSCSSAQVSQNLAHGCWKQRNPTTGNPDVCGAPEARYDDDVRDGERGKRPSIIQTVYSLICSK